MSNSTARGPGQLILTMGSSTDLVQTYLRMVQPQCYVLDWGSFARSWDEAGRVSDRLSPTNECLALVIQVTAWS